MEAFFMLQWYARYHTLAYVVPVMFIAGDTAKKVGSSIVLIPKHADPWRSLVDSLDQFSEDFMPDRAQPSPQQREASAPEVCNATAKAR